MIAKFQKEHWDQHSNVKVTFLDTNSKILSGSHIYASKAIV